MKRVFVILMGFLPLVLVGQTTRTNTTSGSLWFDDGAGWSAGVPTPTSNVIFNNGTEATINKAQSATVANFIANNNVTLNINLGGLLTVNGGFVTDNGSTINVYGNLLLNGDLVVNNNLTLFVSGTFTINGGVDFGNNGNLTITNTGLLTISGDVTATNNTNLVVNGLITIGGNIAVGNGSTISGTGSLTYGGTCTDGNSNFCETSLLPISLLYFKGGNKNNAIRLFWSTASEINFDHFNLERSPNGNDFNSIANINGHGTSHEKRDYTFDDNFPLIGKNYYRLTSVDFDNYKETFNVIVLDYSGEKEFQVSPNPSDGRTITLNFNFDSKEGQVVIYDNMASIVDTFQVNETDQVSFTNTLKDGIYFAKYSSPSFTKAIRFLVKQ